MNNLNEENKNYLTLVDQAEGAYLKREYLEAFLIQSCVIEGVVKNYAAAKLVTELGQSATLKEKFKNFELVRLIDDLLLAGKIPADLYESLNKYRKKRNEVIHGLLEYEDKDKLDQELKEAYKQGVEMKVTIVDGMSRELAQGISLPELEAQVQGLMLDIEKLNPGMWEKMLKNIKSLLP